MNKPQHSCTLGSTLMFVSVIEMAISFFAAIFMSIEKGWSDYHFDFPLFLGILVGGLVSGLILLALSKLVNAADKYLES